MNAPERTTLVVPNDGLAPSQARRFIHERLAGRAPQLCDDAVLLVSELVTNAVRYGRPEIVVHVEWGGSQVRFEVFDSGDVIPRLPIKAPSPGQPSGRGLLIVDAVAARWGVEAAPADTPGKLVWFELDAAA